MELTCHSLPIFQNLTPIALWWLQQVGTQITCEEFLKAIDEVRTVNAARPASAATEFISTGEYFDARHKAAR